MPKTVSRSRFWDRVSTRSPHGTAIIAIARPSRSPCLGKENYTHRTAEENLSFYFMPEVLLCRKSYAYSIAPDEYLSRQHLIILIALRPRYDILRFFSRSFRSDFTRLDPT